VARMRSLKPEFWHDQEITRIPRDARLLYMALWNFADEHSRLQGDPRYLKGQVFPYDDDLNPTKISALLDHLVSIGKVERYTVRGAVYLFLPKLAKHQRLDTEKVPSRLPGPDESTPSSGNVPNESGNFSDQGVNENALSMLHVAGGMEHVAGKPDADASAAESADQRANRLTQTYTSRVKLSNFAAIRGVVRKAVAANYPDVAIVAALGRLADDGRSVTTDTLRHELDGLPTRASPKPSTTDQRVNEALALAERLDRKALG